MDGGSRPPDDHPEWDDKAYRVLRACYKRLVPLYGTSLKDFQTTRWPADARDDMADLVSLTQGVMHCLRQGALDDRTRHWIAGGAEQSLAE